MDLRQASAIVRFTTSIVKLPAGDPPDDRISRSGSVPSVAEQSVRTMVRRGAERYVRDTNISLSYLTHELGYAEQSVLSPACQRWFGCGPSAFRSAIPPPEPGTRVEAAPTR